MKLSSACSAFKLPEEVIYKIYRDAGFEALNLSYLNKEEYDYDGLREHYPLGDDYAERARRSKKILDELGLVCNQTHAPYGLKPTEAFDESSYRFVELVRCIECTAIVGAEAMVIHPLKPQNYEDVFEVNQNLFKALIPYAEKFNVKISLETCHLKYRVDGKIISFIDCAETYCDIINHLGSDRLVACIDLGHTAGGVDHTPEEFVGRMKKGVLHGLHVQDCDYMHDNHTTPFFQHLNWDRIMKALSDIDYTGDFTYEDVNYARYFPIELWEDVIKYRAKVGKYLISLFDKYQAEKKA